MEISITEDMKNPPECIRNRNLVTRAVNEYLERQLDYKLIKSGLPELPRESRLHELADSGIFYNDKRGNTLSILTESCKRSYTLSISGKGLCESISKEMSENVKALLLLFGVNPTCKNDNQ
jgi:hypothetical protein